MDSLENRLKLKGHNKKCLTALLKKIEKNDHIQEDTLIHNKVQTLLKKGFAPDLVRKKLLLKQIDVDVSLIQRLALQFGQTEEKQVKELIKKRLKNKKKLLPTSEEYTKFKRSLLSALQSKGHCADKGLALVEKHLSKLEFS